MATLSSHLTTAPHNLSQSARVEATAAQTTEGANTSSLPLPAGDVDATLNFFEAPADGSEPYNYIEEPPEGLPKQNYGQLQQTVTIHDVRGHESSLTLDHDAFAVISGVPPSAERDFAADESIERNYYPEVERLILDHVPGSNRVAIFDHTIRRADPNAHRSPVNRVHIDQTATSAKQRVILHLGEDAEKLLQGRYRIINVWRPLNGPVYSHPLAFASSASVVDSDIVPIQHRYPERTGQIAGVQHNPQQSWNYLSGMRNDERLLIECFDSEALKPGSNVEGGRVPHTAFVDTRTPEGAPGRESIEVRALVFGP
ncbi:MAG: hypothetical protein M1818_000701 [Claussenomyces sp. TS43310]|nr:MAG: hypothetical protein M1818_000701 [Claussenomyces sp. TS43310]